ncbi:hypothetical protein PQQ88_31070 [Paraburkholderia caledonica]|uniref:hypothetical protein n=1 Tax=Paraburkholderia caledonica TaxID=134536 RepID=UPI0038BC7C66
MKTHKTNNVLMCFGSGGTGKNIETFNGGRTSPPKAPATSLGMRSLLRRAITLRLKPLSKLQPRIIFRQVSAWLSRPSEEAFDRTEGEPVSFLMSMNGISLRFRLATLQSSE